MARTDRTTRIASSVARAAGLPDLPAALAALPGSAFGSLLLEVFRRRAGAVTAAQVLARAARPLHAPSGADARTLHAFDGAALAAARDHEALDLAPALPLGACAALAGIDPNNVLAALRAAEVLADPTVSLALEAAARRRAPGARRDRVRLCASARCVRMQPVDAPAYAPHFRLFALATAGRDEGAHRFETDALAEHALVWLDLVRRLRDAGFRIDGAEVELSDVAAVEAACVAAGVAVAEVRALAAAHRAGAAAGALAARGLSLPGRVRDPRRELGALHRRLPPEVALRLDRVVETVVPRLAAAHPDVPVYLDLSRLEGLGAYSTLMLRIRLRGPPGAPPVIDGGLTRWTQALLSDRKERLFASAAGAELVCKLFAPLRPGGG